ncbi:MAG TPA: helix-turn-helix transcriptional regulator [Gaiellaceae bacterium]|nr:helix-turn-helix transcriptional regulator [Gaiellaceae bacterium]
MPRTAASDLAAKLVGREVRSSRRAVGLTQAELARRLGTSPSYVTNVEAGRLNLTVGQLARIADALGADLHISFPLIALEPVAVRESASGASVPGE